VGTEPPCVVSCGGGAVLRPENVRMMKASGVVVLLTARPETVLNRVKGDDSRPNLKGRMSAEGIAGLMEKRRLAYERAADLTVETDNRTPDQIAEEILSAFRKKQL
ncbi:MAG: shikimate kinase, partial [Lachnospiraceae bacterium]|nr:shikimate kinase [Lachnospiraceae bacterium]